jgi:hypothetical protein
MQQPGLTIADLQSDAASPLLAWSQRAVYKQHINVDSVISEINAEELARKIASKCGATEDYAYGAGKQYRGDGKEVTLHKLMPLPKESDARQTILGVMRKWRHIRHFALDLKTDRIV